MSWQEYAACRGEDVATFFPLPLEHAVRDRALAICSGCDVILQCEEFAESHRTASGIFGGRDWSTRRTAERPAAVTG